MSKVLLRLLRNTHKKNLITDSDKFIWCPMKSGVFAKSGYFKQMGCDGRDFRSILQYVYAENRLADKNFDLPMMKKWAEIIWQLPDNDWFVRDFQQFVEDKYKKYLKKFPESGRLGLTPDEFMSLSIFHTHFI